MTIAGERLVAAGLPAPVPLLGGKGIVTFANDWTADPTSKHQILRRFAHTNPVLWVESAGLRTPQLTSAYDRARLLAKAKAFVRKSRRVTDGLHVMTPPALPYPNSSVAQQVNGLLYRVTIGRELRRLHFDADPIIISFLPHSWSYLRGLRRSLLIYYCVDRWSAFEGVHGDLAERGEEELCRRADLVIASAENLADRCRRFSSEVHYIPHGVDYQHFATALEPGPLPLDLAGIPTPRIGFFGLIHEWVDTDLIARLADTLPYSFVLIGSAKSDLRELEQRKNVYVLGRKPYAELPSYSRGFQAAIVPFRLNELTASVNPIKLREYAAAGLPIVSSPLAEVRRCSDIAVCADDFPAWVDAVQRAVTDGADPSWRRRQSQRVQGDDWAYRCAQIATLVASRAPVVASLGGK